MIFIDLSIDIMAGLGLSDIFPELYGPRTLVTISILREKGKSGIGVLRATDYSHGFLLQIAKQTHFRSSCQQVPSIPVYSESGTLSGNRMSQPELGDPEHSR